MKRVLLGMAAAMLGAGWLALPAFAQVDESGDEVPEPGGVCVDTGEIDPSLVPDELQAGDFPLDVNGDGTPELTDDDGDGVPDIPVGIPGDCDIDSSDAQFRASIAAFNAQYGAQFSSDASALFPEKGAFIRGDCVGQAWSYDADGELIDAALGDGPAGILIDTMPDSFGEQAFTVHNPFRVDTGGTVVYYGALPQEGEGPRNHNWQFRTSGISLDKGGDDNPDGNNRNAGEVDLGSNLPIKFSGNVMVAGDLESQNNLTCEGQGVVAFEGGQPLATIPGGLSALFAAGGLLGLLFNSRPAITWRA